MKKTAFFIVAGIIFLVSCGPIEEWPEASVKNTPSSFSFNSYAVSRSLRVVDENNTFSYSSNASWCTAGLSSLVADYYVYVDYNNTSSARTATVTIKYKDEVMKTISVEQQGYPYIIGNLMVEEDQYPDSWGWGVANDHCRMRIRGYSDWRLPSMNELEILYNNRESIGNFKEDFYWSAENWWGDNNRHWMLNFGIHDYYDWDFGDYRNGDRAYFRCVRTMTGGSN